MQYVAKYTLTQKDKDILIAMIHSARRNGVDIKAVVVPEMFGTDEPVYKVFAGVTLFKDVISYKMFKNR